MSQTSQAPSDPLYRQSLSWPILISTVLVLATFLWAMADEAWIRRPYLGYQSQFRPLYSAHLSRLEERQRAREAELRRSPEYQDLLEREREMAERIRPRVQEIHARLRLLEQQLAPVRETVAVVRLRIQAETYMLEHAATEEARARYQARIDTIKRGPHRVRYPGEDGSDRREVMDFDAMAALSERIADERAYLQRELGRLNEPLSALSRQRSTYVAENLDGPTVEVVSGLQEKMRTFRRDILQIHVEETGLVDRCESCHLGIREPVDILPEDVDGQRVFISHPTRELLDIHDPEIYGCTPCHNGNGIGLTSVVHAHGLHKHWLHPLYPPENFEAGCVHCHEHDLVLDHAPTLNEGKHLFNELGCWGCHPRQGFDVEREQLQLLASDRRDLHRRRLELRRKKEEKDHVYDTTDDLDEARAIGRWLDQVYRLEETALNREQQELDAREKELLQERRRIAPNLKDLKAKVRPEWLPVWLAEPRAFRPDTQMPVFRLDDREVRAISAFLWQNALDVPVPERPPGDPERGRTLFYERGCLGCHAMEEPGEDKLGHDFAANLSRVGEKLRYDYLARWIEDPARRLLPYSPQLGRDVTPEDYADQGLPFRFGPDHSRCPITGGEMVVHQMTTMPSLRLTPQEAEDIASWLMTLRRLDPGDYPEAGFLDDPGLAEEGRGYVAHYGCAGCHEIKGFEDEGKIGTDLTYWGSTPLERLDFALLTKEAKREGWYNPKGFAERKLRQPDLFDKDKVKERHELLRMPDFGLDEEEINALTTLLIGSIEEEWGMPESHRYRPTDHRRDIQEGWWVIEKYNCYGCHAIRPGDEPPLWSLPQFSGPNEPNRPPSLVGQGYRTRPDWLASFLKDPALSKTDPHRNGLRNYLKARMPTFNLTETEVAKLVRFFAAMAGQPSTQVPPVVEPLSPAELRMARDAFDEARCALCHADEGAAEFTEDIIAPSFLAVPRRLNPRWTGQFMLDPSGFLPRTQMPSELFRRDEELDRWVLSAEPPASMRDYEGDHLELLVRYLFQFDQEEAARTRR